MSQNFLTIAVGVQDDEDRFPDDHFGESAKFLLYLYDIPSQQLILLKTLPNFSQEERFHGDPEKSKGIASIIGNVDCILGHAVGKNVLRMREKYVMLLSPSFDVKMALSLLPNFVDKILEEKGKSGVSRKIIHLKV